MGRAQHIASGQLAKCRMEELHLSARAFKDRDPIAGLDIRRSHAAGLSTRVSRMIKRRVEGGGGTRDDAPVVYGLELVGH